MWLLIAFIAVLLSSICRIIQKGILSNSKHDAITFAIFSQFLVVFLIPPLLISKQLLIPSLQNVWGNLILMTSLYGLSSILTYKALKIIPVSDLTIIYAATPLWTTITSFLFLGESILFAKILGIIITFTGILYAFYSHNKIVPHQGHLLAFLGSLCVGFALTNDALLLRTFNPPTYTIISFIFPSLFLGIVFAKKIPLIRSYNTIGEISELISVSLLYALSSLSIYESYKMGGQISKISIILQLNTILTVILGILIFKERHHLFKKIIGTLIVVIGVILIQVPI